MASGKVKKAILTSDKNQKPEIFQDNRFDNDHRALHGYSPFEIVKNDLYKIYSPQN
jgi:hypothetical protein